MQQCDSKSPQNAKKREGVAVKHGSLASSAKLDIIKAEGR